MFKKLGIILVYAWLILLVGVLALEVVNAIAYIGCDRVLWHTFDGNGKIQTDIKNIGFVKIEDIQSPINTMYQGYGEWLDHATLYLSISMIVTSILIYGTYKWIEEIKINYRREKWRNE